MDACAVRWLFGTVDNAGGGKGLPRQVRGRSLCIWPASQATCRAVGRESAHALSGATPPSLPFSAHQAVTAPGSWCGEHAAESRGKICDSESSANGQMGRDGTCAEGYVLLAVVLPVLVEHRDLLLVERRGPARAFARRRALAGRRRHSDCRAARSL